MLKKHLKNIGLIILVSQVFSLTFAPLYSFLSGKDIVDTANIFRFYNPYLISKIQGGVTWDINDKPENGYLMFFVLILWLLVLAYLISKIVIAIKCFKGSIKSLVYLQILQFIVIFLNIFLIITQLFTGFDAFYFSVMTLIKTAFMVYTFKVNKMLNNKKQ